MWGHFILSARHFLLIRMNSAAGNHPWRAILPNQDAFLRWNSSLQDISFKSGWFSPPEFIPTRHFLQIRMNFPAGIHPYKSFSANQDDFLHSKSSLPDISFKSGWFSPLEIISGEQFCRIRMNFPAGIHPCKTFPANQDDFPRRNSSLQDFSCKSGWFSPLEIIPTRHFLQIRMIFPAGIHPCYEVTIVKKRLQEISISRQTTFVFLWQHLERAMI